MNFPTKQRHSDQDTGHLIHHPFHIPRAALLADAFSQDQLFGAITHAKLDSAEVGKILGHSIAP